MQHFYAFLTKALKIHEVTLNSLSLNAVHDIFQLYTLTLCAGHTIQGNPVKSATIQQYLDAASSYLLIVGKRRDLPLIDPNTRKQYKSLSSIIADVKRWEDIPNRRSPVTKRMLRTAKRRAANTHADSKQHAFYDWLVVGMSTAYRRCEWASENKITTRADFPRAANPQRDIYQCLGADIRIYDNNDQERLEFENGADANLQKTRVRWRFQKNSDNNQVIDFAANHTDPDLCITRAAKRIKRRAKRFALTDQDPLSCYRACTNSRQPSWFTSDVIRAELRAIAMATYNYPNAAELRRHGYVFSSHSIRVGATVAMHTAGAADSLIKTRLRWKSDTFLMYLRNTPQLAAQHAHLLNANDADSWDSPMMA